MCENIPQAFLVLDSTEKVVFKNEIFNQLFSFSIDDKNEENFQQQDIKIIQNFMELKNILTLEQIIKIQQKEGQNQKQKQDINKDFQQQQLMEKIVQTNSDSDSQIIDESIKQQIQQQNNNNQNIQAKKYAQFNLATKKLRKVSQNQTCIFINNEQNNVQETNNNTQNQQSLDDIKNNTINKQSKPNSSIGAVTYNDYCSNEDYVINQSNSHNSEPQYKEHYNYENIYKFLLSQKEIQNSQISKEINLRDEYQNFIRSHKKIPEKLNTKNNDTNQNQEQQQNNEPSIFFVKYNSFNQNEDYRVAKINIFNFTFKDKNYVCFLIIDITQSYKIYMQNIQTVRKLDLLSSLIPQIEQLNDNQKQILNLHSQNFIKQHSLQEMNQALNFLNFSQRQITKQILQELNYTPNSLQMICDYFSIKELVLNIINLMKLKIQSRQVDIKLIISDQIGESYSDQSLLRKILIDILNLCVQITFEGHIIIEIFKNVNEICFTIQDTSKLRNNKSKEENNSQINSKQMIDFTLNNLKHISQLVSMNGYINWEPNSQGNSFFFSILNQNKTHQITQSDFQDYLVYNDFGNNTFRTNSAQGDISHSIPKINSYQSQRHIRNSKQSIVMSKKLDQNEQTGILNNQKINSELALIMDDINNNHNNRSSNFSKSLCDLNPSSNSQNQGSLKSLNEQVNINNNKQVLPKSNSGNNINQALKKLQKYQLNKILELDIENDENIFTKYEETFEKNNSILNINESMINKKGNSILKQNSQFNSNLVNNFVANTNSSLEGTKLESSNNNQQNQENLENSKIQNQPQNPEAQQIQEKIKNLHEQIQQQLQYNEQTAKSGQSKIEELSQEENEQKIEESNANFDVFGDILYEDSVNPNGDFTSFSKNHQIFAKNSNDNSNINTSYSKYKGFESTAITGNKMIFSSQQQFLQNQSQLKQKEFQEFRKLITDGNNDPSILNRQTTVNSNTKQRLSQINMQKYQKNKKASIILSQQQQSIYNQQKLIKQNEDIEIQEEEQEDIVQKENQGEKMKQIQTTINFDNQPLQQLQQITDQENFQQKVQAQNVEENIKDSQIRLSNYLNKSDSSLSQEQIFDQNLINIKIEADQEIESQNQVLSKQQQQYEEQIVKQFQNIEEQQLFQPKIKNQSTNGSIINSNTQTFQQKEFTNSSIGRKKSQYTPKQQAYQINNSQKSTQIKTSTKNTDAHTSLGSQNIQKLYQTSISSQATNQFSTNVQQIKNNSNNINNNQNQASSSQFNSQQVKQNSIDNFSNTNTAIQNNNKDKSNKDKINNNNNDNFNGTMVSLQKQSDTTPNNKQDFCLNCKKILILGQNLMEQEDIKNILNDRQLSQVVQIKENMKKGLNAIESRFEVQCCGKFFKHIYINLNCTKDAQFQDDYEQIMQFCNKNKGKRGKFFQLYAFQFEHINYNNEFGKK